ncbi:protein kinase [Blastococcus sp. CT_GayMR16]|uniref:protein kinase domain-containing protein n=1 Tax=Blastococcus sp. CT_GayMR16 TaxID=2559607 RepID=UPI001FD80904|nr:protein kinase [Blastococcus sp. CT_GayMR16]
MEARGGLLGNRYELLVVLASGGMGRVWRARDTLLERPVAVKVLRSEFTGDATFRARFRAEAQHTAALHHPNIASVFDYGELVEDGEQLAYLVMELVEGEALSALLERVGALDAARTLDIVRQTSAALGAAHAAGVVHRDVKPGNVLMGTDGVVKITDFGIAWSASSVPLTGTGQVIGTAHYLSPEQAEGGKATPASDVYALGTVAYECLAGRRAFEGENSVQIALKQIREEPEPLPSGVPAAMRELVHRAMAKDPAARYPDGAALRAAADAVTLTGGTAPIGRTGTHGTAVLPLPPVPLGRTPASSPARRFRRPSPVLLGALAALVVLAVVVALLQTGSRTPSEAGSPSGTTAPGTTTSAPAPPPTIPVAAGGFIGRPVAEVQAELVGRGLQVQLAPVDTGDVAAGLVTAVGPEGELAPGTVVTVSYAVPPVVIPAPVDTGTGAGTGGNGNNGNGNNGNGNGNGNNGNGNGNNKDDEDD